MRNIPSPTSPLSELVLPAWGDLCQSSHYTVGWATTRAEIADAQRLRWSVFADELGAKLNSPIKGLDIDIFDGFCEHLLVKDANGCIVGTYRALLPAKAELCGRWYASDEFYLRPLLPYARSALEVGRSCVHADHRNGTVMLMLWKELARLMERNQLKLLFGCASVSMADGGRNALAVAQYISERRMHDHEIMCRPVTGLPLDAPLPAASEAELPPLLKGYLRLGARIGSAPAWDHAFNCADFLVVLRKDQISARYARHFFGAGHKVESAPERKLVAA